MADLEKVAMHIYWAAYDQYFGADHRHPHADKGWGMEMAWGKISDVQREFCMHQARRALHAMKASAELQASGYVHG